MLIRWWRRIAKRARRLEKHSAARRTSGRLHLAPWIEQLESRNLLNAGPISVSQATINLGTYDGASSTATPGNYIATPNAFVVIPIRVDHVVETDGSGNVVASGLSGVSMVVNFSNSIFDTVTVTGVNYPTVSTGPMLAGLGWDHTLQGSQSTYVSFSETADGNADVVAPVDSNNTPTGDLTNGGATPNGDILEYLTLHVRNDMGLLNTTTPITITDGNLASGGATQFNSYSSVPAIPATVTIRATQPTATLSVDMSQFNGTAAIVGHTYTVPLDFTPTAAASGVQLANASAALVVDPAVIDVTAIPGATITATGSGYTAAPSVMFDAPGAGGVNATGHAIVSGGRVTAVLVDDPGTGYTAAPVITFSGGGGSGAAASAALGLAVSGGSLLPSNGVSISSTPLFVHGFFDTTGVQHFGPENGGAQVLDVYNVSLASSSTSAVIPAGASGSLLKLTFRVRSDATGATTINVVPGASDPNSVNHTASFATTALGADSSRGGLPYALDPMPTNDSTDYFVQAAVTAAGSAYIDAPSVSFTGGGGSGATGHAVLGGDSGDEVVSVVVDSSGSGYTSAPSISFAGGGGSGAVATASLATIDGVFQVTSVDHFSITGEASITMAGNSFQVTVTPQDASNATLAGYTGTIHFTASTPTNGTMAETNITGLAGDSYTFDGVETSHVFTVTLTQAGDRMFTVADTAVAGASISGTSNTVTVSAASATHYTVSAPSMATAGMPVSVTVTALDQFNNVANGYSGTVHINSSDGQASLASDGTLSGGVGTFSATLKTAGSQTITAADTVNSSISGTSGAVTVSAAAADHYTLSAPGTATAGTAFIITVTALDQFNNTATSYNGTVHFASSDSQVLAGTDLPADGPLTQGVGSFVATLKSVGSGTQTITATDTVSFPMVSGTTSPITVSAAAASQLVVTAQPSAAIAGATFDTPVMVAIEDTYGNVVDDSTDTITAARGNLGTTDLQGTTTVTLLHGTGTFSTLSYNTAETMNIAFSTNAGSFTATSPSVVVTAGSPDHMVFAQAPTDSAAGAPINPAVVVDIVDAFGNLTTSTDTVTISASGPGGFTTSGPGVIGSTTQINATSGAATFSNLRLLSVGSYTLSATSTVTSDTLTSSSFSVSGLAVTALNPTPSGFTVTFNQKFAPSTLNLYQVNSISSGAADVVLVDQSASNQVINGSLVLSTGGSGYTSAPTVTISGGGGNGATAHAVLGTGAMSGQVVSLVLDTAGSSYTSVPTVTIAAPSAGTTATAIAAISTSSHAVTGLSLNADGRTFTFVKTGLVAQNGLLQNVSGQGATGSLLNPSDTYQVTLVSGGQAFTTTASGTSNAQLLAGNSGFASNYVTTFAGTSAVPSTSTVEVMIPDFARGPGNTNLNVPNDAQGTSASGGVGSPTQTLAFGGTVTGGTFKLVFGGVTTSIISYSSTAATLQSNVTNALVAAVPSLNGHVSVTGSFPFYGISFDTSVSSPSQVTTNSVLLSGTSPTLTTNMSIGVPVELIIPSGVTNVTSGSFTLSYNADLLSISGGTVNSNLKASNGLSFTVGTPSGSGANATVTISFSATTALSTGTIRLGGLTASVPSGAAYKAKDLLHFSSVSLNNGIAVVGGDAVHVVADQGDAAGVGSVTGPSATPIAQIGSNINKGLAAYLLADPVIIADLNHDGAVGSSDGTILNAFVGGATRLVIPTNTQASFRPATSDPTVSIPTNLTVGANGIVSVPVNIDDPAPAGSTGMTDAVLALAYDPQVLSVSTGDIHLGSIPAAGQNWTVHSTINATSGTIVIDLYGFGAPITSTQAGSLVSIDFHRTATPASGATPINLAEGVDPNGRGVIYTSINDASGPYILTPAPTNAANDPVDGSVVLGGQALAVISAPPSAVAIDSSATTHVPVTAPMIVIQTPATVFSQAAISEPVPVAGNINEAVRAASLLMKLGQAVLAMPRTPQPVDTSDLAHETLRAGAVAVEAIDVIGSNEFVIAGTPHDCQFQDRSAIDWFAQGEAWPTTTANRLVHSTASDAELAASDDFFAALADDKKNA